MTVKDLHINLCIMYANFFAEHGKERGFALLRIKSVLEVLNIVYLRFLSEGIPKISELDNTEKNRIWNIAKQHQHDQELRIKASKGAYVLSLISNE